MAAVIVAWVAWHPTVAILTLRSVDASIVAACAMQTPKVVTALKTERHVEFEKCAGR